MLVINFIVRRWVGNVFKRTEYMHVTSKNDSGDTEPVACSPADSIHWLGSAGAPIAGRGCAIDDRASLGPP